MRYSWNGTKRISDNQGDMLHFASFIIISFYGKICLSFLLRLLLRIKILYTEHRETPLYGVKESA